VKQSEKSKDKPMKKPVLKASKKKSLTDSLIEKYNNKTEREIGSVVNGDPDMVYVHVGDNIKTQQTVQKLIDVGYQKEEDPNVVKTGYIGGNLYKIPKDFSEFLKAKRSEKIKKGY
tara:strand:+ start:709 stop:1056 length:348 start_codon:yes stop_codon:yes gene_type:complete